MISVAAFDFETKELREISPADVPAVRAAGQYCWVDIDCSPCGGQTTKCSACADCLAMLGVSEFVRSQVLGPDEEGRYDVYDDCLHFAVTEARIQYGRLHTAHVDVVLGDGYLVTYRKREADLISQMKRTYKEDFRKFAKSPGFLLYEIGDHLLERYRKALRSFVTEIEQTQLRLFADVDDQIFKQVSAITSDLLVLRKVVMASRELFHELSTRKSAFVSETTQPFLENMAGTLDRLASDISVERDVLGNTLGTYMGIVSHRTNRIVSRLTVLSAIFLPLGLLVSMWGSSFKDIPGAGAPHAFEIFCGILFLIALCLLALMKRNKWL